MEIRNATMQDLAQLESIWHICFPEDSEEHIAWFFSERFSCERALVLCEENRITSCLHLAPYRVRIRSKEFDAPFVVGAATLPEVQGKGRMRSLLVDTYARLRTQGAAVSMLYPFSYGFYRRLGYEVVSDQCVVTMPLAELKEITNSSFARKNCEGFEQKPLTSDALKFAYHAMMTRFDTVMIRSDRSCFERIDEWTRDHLPSMQCCRGNTTEGYALYSQHENELTVDEFVYANGAAMLFLLGQLAAVAQEAGQDIIQFPLPPNERIDFLLEDGRGKVLLDPFAMLRIIDVERLFGGLTLAKAERFTLSISDALCPWNNGVYEIQPGEKTQIKRSSTNSDASCTITTLAQLASGYLSGEEAQTLGLLVGDTKAAAAFTSCKNYVFDRY